MKRRDILKYTAYATGAAVSAPLVGTLLTGCKVDRPEETGRYTPKFFSQEEFGVLQDIIDTILPKTDSPSATEQGVHATIDHMVGQVYNAEDREAYGKRFKVLLNHLNQAAGEQGFASMEEGARGKMLLQVEANEGGVPEAARKAYRDVRQQTIAYYLSTEHISKNFLNYLPVPGDYLPCMPLADVGGKAWAI